MMARISNLSTKWKIFWSVIAVLTVLFVIGLFVPEEPDEPAAKQVTAPTEADVLTAACPNPAEKVYFTRIGRLAGEALDNMDGFIAQSEMVADNALVIMDDGWVSRTARYMRGLKDFIAAVRDIAPPPSVRSIHDLNLQAMDFLDEALDAYAHGIDNLDEKSIQRATAATIEYNHLFGQATTAMSKFCR